MIPPIRFHSAAATAIVAGLFSLVVCGMLLVDFADRLTKVPLDAPEFVALKSDLANAPGDEKLKEQIRDLDYALRLEYFREQQYTKRGVFLLLAGIVVTLLTGKWAVTLRRKLPTPELKPTGPDVDERLSVSGLWAVGVLMIALGGITWAMNAGYPSPLPESSEALALLRQKAAESPEAPGTKRAPRRPELVPLPAPEQWAQSWPRFRGPGGDGISTHANIPTEWDGASGEGILWKSPVSLPGTNSPIVWKDRVYLAGATAEKRAVYCFNTADGALVWEKEVTTDASASPQEVKLAKDTGYSAPTMATDGRFVFALFANGDLASFDFAGNQLWTKSIGVPKNTYGHASSLATYQGWIIVQYDQGTAKDDLSRLLAFDGATGRTIWQAKRATPNSWASPIVIEHDGTSQIITCADPFVIAYSPQMGTELWRAESLKADVGPSPVYRDGMLYVANEFPGASAIRLGGAGNVTETHVAWQAEYGLPDTCSPLATDEFVLLMPSYGTLACYDRNEGGEPLWEEDFEADFAASPSLVGSHVYLFSRDGKGFVIEPTRDECKRISESELGEDCVTSPAFQDGRIYIRTEGNLFCIGAS